MSLPRFQWEVTQGRVQLPVANMAQFACLAVKAQPHKHRPPLWAVMTASLYSVPSYIFKPRSLDVSPAAKSWVDRLSGHTVIAVCSLLMLDTVRAGAGGGGGGVDTLEELVVSRYLRSFHVHVQRSPGALLENPSECKWFPPAPGLSSAVIHALCFPHLLLATRKLFFSSFPPPHPPKTPSLSFLPVVSLLLPTSFGKSPKIDLAFSFFLLLIPTFSLLLLLSHPVALSPIPGPCTSLPPCLSTSPASFFCLICCCRLLLSLSCSLSLSRSQHFPYPPLPSTALTLFLHLSLCLLPVVYSFTSSAVYLRKKIPSLHCT